jgi:hypothetical protein
LTLDRQPWSLVAQRTKDILSSNGHIINLLLIDEFSIALEGAPTVSSSMTIVGYNGVKPFGMRPHGETYSDIEEYAKQLNAEVDEQSNIHGESWSQQFATGIEEGKSLVNKLNLATLSASIGMIKMIIPWKIVILNASTGKSGVQFSS